MVPKSSRVNHSIQWPIFTRPSVAGFKRPLTARVTTDPISFEDVWITVAKSMGIAVDAQHVTRSGRPIRIFNGGQPIHELLDD
jgi:hypothetical protein